MYFESLRAALYMGGHGQFVWSAAVISCVFIVFLLIVPMLRSRRIRREVAGHIRRQQAASKEVENASGS